MYQGTVIRADLKKHVPPDTTAMIFWLKNRKKGEWRDRMDHEHSGEVTTRITVSDDIPAK